MGNKSSLGKRKRASEFSSYKIDSWNQVMQNDVTLRVANLESFLEFFFSQVTGDSQ